MSKAHRMMSVDPGTLNTGVVVVELQPDGTLKMLHTRKISRKKGDAWKRVNEILEDLIEIVREYKVNEIWVELYVPYGRRKGSLWNMMLVGALLYLPVTRSLDDTVSYGVYAQEWKRWLTKAIDTDRHPAKALAESLGIALTDEQYADISDPHVADALGLLLFSQYRETNNEYATSKTSDGN